MKTIVDETTSIDLSHYGGPGAALSNLALACFAEVIGTFLLVLAGTAIATSAVLGKGAAGPAYDSLLVALSLGLIVGKQVLT